MKIRNKKSVTTIITICGKDIEVVQHNPQQEDILKIREIMRDAKITMAELARHGDPPLSRERVRQLLNCSNHVTLRDSTMMWIRSALEAAMRGGKK